ncbi:MAG TPA: hypothetical protein VM661_04250 [Candidatus Sulfotelmatobacter sp.]|jgi:hypothetical protein|nr:hypothetical protein [Candidatus Sulfotelmatobacter sp.]
MSKCVFPPEVIAGLNAEIMSLMQDLQGYMRERQEADFQGLEVSDRMTMLKARSALTLQITSMAAWGLYQAALLAEDDIPQGLTPDDVPDALASLGDAALPPLPEAFRNLLGRSDGLFHKVRSLQAAA